MCTVVLTPLGETLTTLLLSWLEICEVVGDYQRVVPRTAVTCGIGYLDGYRKCARRRGCTEILPVVVEMVSPGGSVPEARANLYGAVPPDAVSVEL